jgi:hypothetical protein
VQLSARDSLRVVYPEAFDCGEEALNKFLRRHARTSHELGAAKTFLAIDDAPNNIIFWLL